MLHQLLCYSHSLSGFLDETHSDTSEVGVAITVSGRGLQTLCKVSWFLVLLNPEEPASPPSRHFQPETLWRQIGL